jgi:hypothetical protein
MYISIMGALALNMLTGYAGQISLGHAAFMASARRHRNSDDRKAVLAGTANLAGCFATALVEAVAGG